MLWATTITKELDLIIYFLAAHSCMTTEKHQLNAKNPQWIASNPWTVFNCPKCTQMSHLGILPNSVKILARSEADLSVGSGIFQALPSHRTTLFLWWCTLTVRATSERVCTHKANPSHAPTYSRTKSKSLPPTHTYTHWLEDTEERAQEPSSFVRESTMRTGVKGLYRNPVLAAHAVVYRLQTHKNVVHKRVLMAECKGREGQKLVRSSLRFQDLEYWGNVANATEADVFRVPHRINSAGNYYVTL
jgi:hypothetical protein